MNQNSVREEIKCRLQAGNACYYLLQNLLSSSLLSKNIKVKIYRTIILAFVFPMKLVSWFFTCAGNVALVSAYLPSGSCVSASQSGFFLSSQRVLKYAGTNVTEFHSSRRIILMKIHTNIFVLKSTSVL